MKLLSYLDTFIESITKVFLVIAVFLMLSLSVGTIVLRWFNESITWFEPLVRHLVFLSAFLGGVLATGKGSHIGIDVVGKYFESKQNRRVKYFIDLSIAMFAFAISLWLIKASVDFAGVEYKYGKVVFLGLHSGTLVSIIPFGFSLIAYRFFYIFAEKVMCLIKNKRIEC